MSDTWRPFIVRRTTGGDVQRSATPWYGGLRYGPVAVDFDLVKTSTLSGVPIGYDTTWVTVQIPGAIAWTQAVMVRGGFGIAMTPLDGVPVWYVGANPASGQQYNYRVADSPLTEGRWYYYSLFLWVGGQWVHAADTEVLVPANYHHSERLFTQLPPYYQKVDDEQSASGQSGPLRRFLQIFGYDLDYTRTLAEGVMNCWSPDFAPLKLTIAAGENLGFHRERALGGTRYRALVQQLFDLNDTRGTQQGLQDFIFAASNYETAVVQGPNALLATDDAESYEGSGHWVPCYDPLIANITDPTAGSVHPAWSAGMPKDQLTIAKYATATPVPAAGRGVLEIKEVAGGAVLNDVVIACGLGITQRTSLGVPQTDPLYYGIPVHATGLYEFQFQYQRPAASAIMRVVGSIMWFDNTGAYLSTNNGPTTAVSDGTAWTLMSVQANAPTNAYYAIPTIWWFHASNPFATRLLSGLLFGESVGRGGNITPLSPDVFLTLGVATKTLAGPKSILGQGQ